MGDCPTLYQHIPQNYGGLSHSFGTRFVFVLFLVFECANDVRFQEEGQ